MAVCSALVLIPGVVTTGSTLYATHEMFEPQIAPGAASSVWYGFVPPGFGTYTLSTVGSSFAPAIALYSVPLANQFGLSLVSDVDVL